VRTRKVVMLLFVFAFVLCIPFAHDFLRGDRMVHQLQTHDASSNAILYVTYAIFVFLLCVLVYPIIGDKIKKNIPKSKPHNELQLLFKVEIEKKGMDSLIFVRRSK